MSDQPASSSPDEMENCRRPNMLPRQWDLSEMLSALSRDRRQHAVVPAAQDLGRTTGETVEPSLFEPCPETNTMPSGWDLSEL